MSLRAEASRTLLGYLWWILEPLLLIAIFYAVFGLVLKSPRADFLAFLIVGKLPFQWFSSVALSCANSIVMARPLIEQMEVSKLLFPLSTAHEMAYKAIVIFLFMLALLMGMGYEPHITWLWLVPLFLTQYLLVATVGLYCAILVAIARDFSKVIALGVTAMLFGSGIFWDYRALPENLQSILLAVNPLAVILDAYRQVLLYNTGFEYWRLPAIAVVSLFMVVCGALLLKRYSTWIALRIFV